MEVEVPLGTKLGRCSGSRGEVPRHLQSSSNELATPSGVYPASAHIQLYRLQPLPHDPKRDSAVKKIE